MDTPTAELAASVVERVLGWWPATVRRFSNGSAHFVYEAMPHDGVPIVVRIGRPDRRDGLRKGAALMQRLGAIGVPLPELLATGDAGDFPYVLMQRLPGVDLGDVVHSLSGAELKAVAERVAAAQVQAARIGNGRRYGYAASAEEAPFDRWSLVPERNLDRSRQRLEAARLFDPAVVERVAVRLERHRPELDAMPAVPFLHDTTTRNVIVDGGRFSGIVDVDDLCFGDPRYAPALTRAALLAHAGPLEYVNHWLAAAGHADDHIFRLYVLIFLLDLMGEHGQAFNGNERPSTAADRERLQRAFDRLIVQG